MASTRGNGSNVDAEKLTEPELESSCSSGVLPTDSSAAARPPLLEPMPLAEICGEVVGVRPAVRTWPYNYWQ
jgi:hypothetical protein